MMTVPWPRKEHDLRDGGEGSSHTNADNQVRHLCPFGTDTSDCPSGGAKTNRLFLLWPHHYGPPPPSSLPRPKQDGVNFRGVSQTLQRSAAFFAIDRNFYNDERGRNKNRLITLVRLRRSPQRWRMEFVPAHLQRTAPDRKLLRRGTKLRASTITQGHLLGRALRIHALGRGVCLRRRNSGDSLLKLHRAHAPSLTVLVLSAVHHLRARAALRSQTGDGRRLRPVWDAR